MAKIKINNIVRYEQNVTDRPGALSATINRDDGDYLMDLDEGVKYPTGADNVGTPGRFPCTWTLAMENIGMVSAMLTADPTTHYLVGNAHGSNNNRKWTISNGRFRSLSLQASRQADAMATLEGFAYSADGSTHPLAEETTDPNDTTAPTGTKTKTNNIVSVTYGGTSMPGVMSVQINVNLGQFLPDHDEGELYPVGADNVGLARPVTGSVSFEDVHAADQVGGTAADLVIVLAAAGSGSNQTLTLDNVIFPSSAQAMRRQADGEVNLPFFNFADDGDTLPFTVA